MHFRGHLDESKRGGKGPYVAFIGLSTKHLGHSAAAAAAAALQTRHYSLSQGDMAHWLPNTYPPQIIGRLFVRS